MRGLLFASVLVLVGSAAASRTDYLNLKKKFASIEHRQVKAGTRVPITSQELNAYVQTELPRVAPPGIRDPKVELIGNNKASGRAMVDFVKLRSAQGKPPGFILRNLLQGEHEVTVTTRVRSSAGTATVDLERVEISGIPVSGNALDYVVRNYLVPHYPQAKIGQPFELKYRVDRLEVNPGVAYVVMK